jgi:hypothetical protein
MIKILIIVWDKSHVTLVTNDNEFWMKIKNQQNTLSLFD